MSSDMRLRFDDEDMKPRLKELASAMGISLNTLVNQIIKAKFSPNGTRYLDMMIEISQMEKESV